MYPPRADHARALSAAAPHASFEHARDEASAQALIRDADVVLGNRYFLQSLPYAERLRWMQSNSTGVDLILSAGNALDGIVLTCARGVYDDEVADHALALVLALTRGIHVARDAQLRREWNRVSLATLRGKKVVVLGWGGIGRAIGERVGAFGADVHGVGRGQEWRALLPEADVVVCALPLTPLTRRLVGASELDLLPRSAFVVNVGRAATIDEPALLERLRSGAIAGAALDVVEREPPPHDDPVWDVPNLLLTPHVARSPEQPPYRWEPLFVENLRRFAAGEELLNVVDRDAGY